MGIKAVLANLIPSIRMGNAIMQKCDLLSSQLIELDYKNEYLFWLTQQLTNESTLETKMRVFRNMPKATGRLREIQLKNFELLLMIKEICEKNNLSYFLLWGTLLGSVRHEGFIPWDDDIDIGMPYKDYLKFKEAVATDNRISTDIYYCYRQNDVYNIIKVKFKKNNQYFVDIFLYDYFDAESTKALHERLSAASIEFNNSLKTKLAQTYFDTQLMNKPVSNPLLDSYYYKIRKDIYQKYGFTGQGSFFAECPENYTVNRNYIYDINTVFPLSESKFELSKFYVFKNVNTYLSNTYGDIWSLPNKIRAHHLNEIEQT